MAGGRLFSTSNGKVRSGHSVRRAYGMHYVLLLIAPLLVSCLSLRQPCPPLDSAAPDAAAIAAASAVYREKVLGLGIPEIVPVGIRKPECGIYLDILIAGISDQSRNRRV